MTDEPVLTIHERLDDAFRRAELEPSTPPTHFYLNLTETCNIRCRHCITGAPEKTERGTGVSMDTRVLDALRPHLAHAMYVGLTHAGEPITSPAMDPLLARLAEAREGAPTVVHVLTNGLALSERRFIELSSGGVSSWSFSVDGMSTKTHDVVRIGSKIDRLMERIRQLSATRYRDFPHVRMGIAWTLMKSNVDEIEALVRFSAEARLDWVKLEELVPVNDFSEGERIVEAQVVESAIARAMRVGGELGIPVLDHTRPVDVWRCRFDVDPAMARYAELDDFVNRVEINPCRFPYEVVCVEPNGDVKPQAFEYPSAGNLLSSDLIDIWRGPAFRRVRRLARMRRLCGEGPVTCPIGRGPAEW